jgi:hypothetical protein
MSEPFYPSEPRDVTSSIVRMSSWYIWRPNGRFAPRLVSPRSLFGGNLSCRASR